MTSSPEDAAAEAEVSIFPVQYRLSTIARRPGGRSDAEMLERASAGVATVHAQSLDALDNALSDLNHAVIGQTADLDAIYRAAIGINEIAALVGFETLGRAAFGLCNLVARQRLGDIPAFKTAAGLHFDTMKLLRSQPDMPLQAQETLLTGLKALVPPPSAATKSSATIP